MEAKSDPPYQFEHSHANLTKLALEVHQMLFSESPRGLPVAMQRRRIAERLKLLGEELLHHFAREEEGLFSFIRSNLPAKSDTVDCLIEAHDTICGAIVRLVHLLEGGSSADTYVSVFAYYYEVSKRFTPGMRKTKSGSSRRSGHFLERANARSWRKSFRRYRFACRFLQAASSYDGAAGACTHTRLASVLGK